MFDHVLPISVTGEEWTLKAELGTSVKKRSQWWSAASASLPPGWIGCSQLSEKKQPGRKCENHTWTETDTEKPKKHLGREQAAD